MIVSAAFGHLTDVLDGIESSAVEIQRVEVPERNLDDEKELTAEMTVSVPALAGLSLGEDVSVDGEPLDEDGRVELDLSVTVPADAEVAAEYGLGDERPGDQSSQSSVPAYKDPEALATVYDEYSTFPEMTEALGVDVTSETVRRYMVEYDIHDPSDNAAPAAGLELSEPQSTGSDPETESADPPETESANESEPGEHDDLGGRSVAALLAEEAEESDDNLVADGLGVPQDLTVAELATTVNQSDSVHEVTRRLDLSRGHARRLLGELDLLDLVTHRLAAGQIRVSHAEIRRRITTETH